MGLNNILAKTEEYLQIPAVIRFEQLFMKHLAADFCKENYKVEEYDRLIAVSKKHSKSPKILIVHIDRHGIVTNWCSYFEYAFFNAQKYYKIKIKAEEWFFQDTGESFLDEIVYAYNRAGKVLGEGKVFAYFCDFKKKDLLFGIYGLEKLLPETPIAYKSQLIVQNGKISSQLDNVVCVAVAHQLVQDGFDGKIIFSTEEEVGRSWRYIVDYLKSLGIESKELINLDTTPYEDPRSVEKGLIILRNRDANSIFNKNLIKLLKEKCSEAGIGYEVKDEVIEVYNAKLPKGEKPKRFGLTELGRIIQHTRGQFNGTTIQLPTTNYHTNHETTSTLALQNYYQALLKLL